jgi:hypothetical protein
LLIALARLFDFLNGFHDRASIVATMIASRALMGRQAPGTAAMAYLVGSFLVGDMTSDGRARHRFSSLVIPGTALLCDLLDAGPQTHSTCRVDGRSQTRFCVGAPVRSTCQASGLEYD